MGMFDGTTKRGCRIGLELPQQSNKGQSISAVYKDYKILSQQIWKQNSGKMFHRFVDCAPYQNTPNMT